MAVTGKRRAFDFSADTTPEQVLAAIERNYSTSNPDIGKVQSCALRNGPKIYKFAVLQQIVDRHTKEHHHNALTLKTYRKLKEGWQKQDERSISLDDENSDEISILETFISDFRSYTGQERKSYGIVESKDYEKFTTISSSEVGDTINEILEDADNYHRIISQGGLSLIKDVINWAFQQENPEPLVEQLNTLTTDTLKELATVAGISQINKILEIWELNSENDDEEFWQSTLTEFSWIISQIFAAPVILYKEKAYVGGKTIDNVGGNLVDMIYRNSLSSNLVLVELKTPCTGILGKEYRQTFSMSNEMSGAISQTLNYKHQIQQNYVSLQMADKKDVFEVINPRTLLIIGNFTKEISVDNTKIEAFELFRQNLKDVCILTYDELFAKVEILKSILQKGK
jgi:hypothetical protein